jgi:hypothetical protein
MPGLLDPISLFHSHSPSHSHPCVHSFEPDYKLQRRVPRTKTTVSAFFPSQSLYHSSSSLIRYAWSLLLNHDAFLLCHLMQITPQVYVCSTTVQYCKSSLKGQYREKVSLPRPNSWTKSKNPNPPCYFHSHLYSFALRFLFLQAHATFYDFYSLVTVHVHCKGERRKT